MGCQLLSPAVVAEARVGRTRPADRVRALAHPLTGLLVLTAVLGVTWALLVPPWQSPDESLHFAYAQSLAERFALPGSPTRPLVSPAQTLAATSDNALLLPFDYAQMRPVWSEAGFRDYLAKAASHPSNLGGGPNPESANPPLLYLYDDLAYWASGDGNAVDLLYAMRVWNVTLLLLAVWGAWLLAGEVFGRRRVAQLTCATVVGLIPAQTFILTSINPDALLVPLWTFGLWLGCRLITRRAQTVDVIAIFAITAAAILTKSTGYALVPPVLLAAVIGWARGPRAERASSARRILLASLALVIPVLGWIGLSRSLGRPAVNTVAPPPGLKAKSFSIKEFVYYVWQFYLPRLPFMTTFTGSSPEAIKSIWIEQGWGVFGYEDVLMPTWVYAVLGAVTGVVSVAAVGLLTRIRERTRLLLLAFFGLALLSLLTLLHVSAYRSLLAHDGPLLQGRYLLPLSGLFGLAVALIVTRLPARWQGAVAGAVIGAMLVLQVLALGTIVRTYYT